MPFDPDGNIADRSGSLQRGGTWFCHHQHAVLETADPAATSGPGCIHQDVLASMENGQGRPADYHSRGNTHHPRKHSAWPGTVPEDGMLEMPWPRGAWRWSIGRDVDRQ